MCVCVCVSWNDLVTLKFAEGQESPTLRIPHCRFLLPQFLERCTGLLDLPFAARRIFDQGGKEHFSLRALQRDALVYVSCGEPWSDPTLSKAEQQRRYLLSNLAADVEQITQYLTLRDPEGEL